LSAFAASCFACARVPCLFAPGYLLRLSAAKVRPQCLGEATGFGGLARTGCARQNWISSIRARPIIGAGQAHDLSLSKNFAKQARAFGGKMVSQVAGGNAEVL
jgi:hypothetical protein